MSGEGKEKESFGVQGSIKMRNVRLVFAYGLVVISLLAMGLGLENIALLSVGAIAGMFVPNGSR